MVDQTTASPGVSQRFRRFKERVKIFKAARQSYLQSYQKDPLAFWLINKFKLSPLKSALLGAGIVGLTYLIGFALHWLQNREVAGITRTAVDIVYDFGLIPVIYGYYVWVSTAAPLVFFRLSGNGISLGRPGGYHTLVTRLSKDVINHKLVFMFSFAAALTTASVYLSKAVTYPSIWGAGTADFWVLYLVKIPVTWMIPWYMVCVIFLKEVLSIWSFNRLLVHRDLKINMFHPDKCGGLKPIGDYLLTFTYLIMGCGFGFVLLIYRSIEFGYFHRDRLVHLGLFIYLILSFFFFYFPLHPVHRLMKRLKREIQARIEQKRFLPSRAFTPAMLGKFVFAAAAPILLLLALIAF